MAQERTSAFYMRDLRRQEPSGGGGRMLWELARGSVPGHVSRRSMVGSPGSGPNSGSRVARQVAPKSELKARIRTTIGAKLSPKFAWNPFLRVRVGSGWARDPQTRLPDKFRALVAQFVVPLRALSADVGAKCWANLLPDFGPLRIASGGRVDPHILPNGCSFAARGMGRLDALRWSIRVVLEGRGLMTFFA